MALSTNAQKVAAWWEAHKHTVGNKNPERFGHKDYGYLLMHQVQQGPGNFTGSVTDLRIAALEFLRANDNEGLYLLAENNMEGGGGLIDNLARSDHAWSLKMTYDGPGTNPTEQGEFGYVDLMHARSHGKDNETILKWMRDNKEKVTTKGDLYGHLYEAMGSPSDIPSTIDEGALDGGTPTIGGEDPDDGTETSPETGETGPVKDDEGKDVGGTLYGLQDYQKQLKTIWDETKNPSEMHKHRKAILDWIEKEAKKGEDIHENNMPGKPDGLYEKIKSSLRAGEGNPVGSARDIGGHGDAGVEDIYDAGALKLGTWGRDYGDLGDQDKSLFTEADMLIAIAGGHDKYEIYRALRNNPDWYSKNETANNFYKQIRQDLIDVSPVYDDYHTSRHYWRLHLQNPLFIEVGEYMNQHQSILDEYTGGKKQNWENLEDMEDLWRFVTTHLPEGKTIDDFNSDEMLSAVLDDAGAAPDLREPGEYWEQWGPTGPPDLEGSDELPQPGDSDLTWIQKMVAAAGFKSRDEKTWQASLEAVENKFLGEMFDKTAGKWKDAPDEWGLDIMRVDADGEALEFTASSGAGNETWYDTLTKGKIDWAFYQDSKIYQKAKEVLGLEGYYTESGLGVEGIRKANVWVHGQAALIAEGGPDWTQWKPPEDWKKEYKAEPLPITGYTPDDLKTPKTPKDISGPPTINIPDVTIKRPANLDKKIGKIVGEE